MAEDRGTVELVADVTGEGPVTVLLHGITEDARSWDPLVAPLAEDRTVVAVDLRGHGRSPEGPVYDPFSMAADVHALLARHGLDDEPMLIGHSMGGVVAVAYGATHATRAIVNVDQPLDLAAFQTQVRELEPMLRGEGLEAAITGIFDAMRGPLAAAEVERIAALRQPRRSVVLGIWAPLLELDAEELDELVLRVVADVQAPVLSLHGIDPGPDYPAWLRARLPSAEVEVWADHGHYPHLVDPERFIARIRSFAPAR